MIEQVHIGHYVLGQTIGQGGFAKVKQAVHDLTGVKVAVKILNKRKMKNKNMISKVKREIKILKFINHPNIIKLYQVFDTTNDIFVIMELAQKGQLYEYIRNNQIHEQQAKYFFKQIMTGVDYAHKKLITHRDLKPENILMTKNKLIKIVDFGFANIMKDGKLLKTACGSPNYAAPQIVGERKYQGTSVDIWSCGVILYTLLVGQFPFNGETLTALYRKIQQGIYTIPNNVNPLAADLISKMLQVDPYKRIKIYEIMNHSWLRSHIPLYLKIPLSFSNEKQQLVEIDEHIFKQAKQKFPKLNEANHEKLKKSIKRRDDESFVITYQLLRDRKDKNQNAQFFLTNMNKKNTSMIIQQIQNIVVKKQYYKKSDFQYGKRFLKSAKILAQKVMYALKIIGIQYQIKSPQYTIKCLYILQGNSQKKHFNQQQMVDEKQEVTKQQKFTKKQIKFILQIYCIDPRSFQHLIDLQISQGHPIVFFNLAHKFFQTIEQLCN